jgi:RHS repeat-associated protein
VYDAWNRLVKVKDSGGTTLETFAYDGLNRRVSVTAGGTTTDLYYSAAWQVLEEKVGSNTTNRYVWSPVYVDALVLRDRDADTNAANGLEERLWVQQDANWNVTALVDGTGAVAERYAYDPFGSVTVYSPTYSVRTSSLYAWDHYHQGLRWDATATLYDNFNRWYGPSLGRFTSLDPVGLGPDVNAYRYVGNGPVNRLDPSGLQPPAKPLTLQDLQDLELRAALREALFPPPPKPRLFPGVEVRNGIRIDMSRNQCTGGYGMGPVAPYHSGPTAIGRTLNDVDKWLDEKVIPFDHFGGTDGPISRRQFAYTLFLGSHPAPRVVVPGLVAKPVAPVGRDLFATTRGQDFSRLTNRQIGDLGEDVARNFLRDNHYTDIFAVQNRSGNGIDIVARTRDGRLAFFEVKTSSTGNIGSLSARQGDMRAFTREVLEDAAFGRGRYRNIDATTRANARSALERLNAAPNELSGSVIGVDLQNEIIRVSPWR